MNCKPLFQFNLYNALTWIIRILTGATFIFSGFVKAIDPWGTLYKLTDYMGALHLPVYRNILIVATFALCAYEFTIGVFLLLGCFRKSAPWLAALLMGVMLPLTLWIAIKNPVEDCGCFGDAFIIGNWTTFWKNVVLCCLIGWLIKFNSSCRCLISIPVQWLGLLLTISYIVAISMVGYLYQPLIDFRPYKVGENLIDDATENGDEKTGEKISFIYSKDGEEKRFGLDDELPDEESGWVFVRRETDPQINITVKSGTTSPSVNGKDTERNFRIWDDGGESDVTEEVMTGNDKILLLMMPDLKDVSIATTWQINSLYTWAEEHNIEFIGIVNGSEEAIANWRDLSLADYPIYTADDTQIKMVARGNPAVVYINDGKIVWKSTLRALGITDFQSSEASDTPEAFARDNKSILFNITGVYLILIALLVFFSFIPYRRLFVNKTDMTPATKIEK